MKTPLSIETELIGMPSGQVLGVYSAYIPKLYNYAYIMFNPKLDCWTFYDENEHKIKMVINKRDLFLF